LNPSLASVYDAQRIVVAAFFAEVCNQEVLYFVLEISRFALQNINYAELRAVVEVY